MFHAAVDGLVFQLPADGRNQFAFKFVVAGALSCVEARVGNLLVEGAGKKA